MAAQQQRLGMAPLAEGGRVAYALTGSGPPTMALEVATVAAVAEALGIADCDVLGWSLGAAVAAQWAAAHPERVSRLVLYGGWATGDALGDEDSQRHLLGLLASHWGLGTDLLTDLFAPEADAGTRRTLARYQRAASSADTAVALLRLAYELDVLPLLAQGRVPAVIPGLSVPALGRRFGSTGS